MQESKFDKLEPESKHELNERMNLGYKNVMQDNGSNLSDQEESIDSKKLNFMKESQLAGSKR